MRDGAESYVMRTGEPDIYFSVAAKMKCVLSRRCGPTGAEGDGQGTGFAVVGWRKRCILGAGMGSSESFRRIPLMGGDVYAGASKVGRGYSAGEVSGADKIDRVKA